MKKQSAWRNTTAITNPQMFGAPAPAAAAPAVETKEEKAVVATEVVPPIAAAPIATHAAIVLSRSIEQPAKEDEKVVEKIAAVDAVAEKKEEKESHKSHKKEEEKKEDLHKPHKKDDKTKEEKEKRRALKKKKVTEKKAAETVAETPERHTERKASPPLKVAVEKENGTGIRTKAVLSPSQSMITLSPLSNSPSRRALASHNNGSELPWLV